MALVTDSTRRFIKATSQPGNEHWNTLYEIGDKVPVSGIYRCQGCGHEITSNARDPFPPQNKHQHSDGAVEVLWQLIVMTQTK
ncbi:protein L [Pseudomonas sp. 21LCFQ02]|uniref:protein L n=1 Tax=Pseudomonas sp. 21LCFQ02 TaxID=2957505 RepID=UPI00209ABB44|nr:protein L [Pseudomonas sp. 21LCFQ02]MCO8166829.1 protein L [Pseudomonas sp. 21LCFQ02]